MKPAGELELGGGVITNGLSVMNAGLTVWGTFLNPSGREYKTDIAPVDSREILKRVVQLPIFSWRYKAEENGFRQIGPMADDFHNALGIGDGHLLPVGTTAGVSLAAIRGLNEIVEENKSEVAELRSANADLLERIAKLERAIAESK